MKVRCTVCREYWSPDEMLVVGTGRNLCSEKCRQAQRDKKPKKRSSRVGVTPDVYADVMKRDGAKCRFCWSPWYLHVHHVLYRSQGGEHTPENLITLCEEHHSLVHSNKKRYQPLLVAYLIARPTLSVPQYERKLNGSKDAADR